MKNRITVFGSFVADLMARSKTLPLAGETVKGEFFKISAGGKGSNQAVAAKRAGASVDMITKVGEDQFKDLAFQSFTNENMSTDYIFLDEKESTGIALIMVSEDTGQNIINVVPGASYNIRDEDIENAKEIILSNKFMLLQLETNLDAILKVIDMAYENDTKITLNPAPVIDLPNEIYKKLYAITPNETEAEKLSGIKIETDEDIVRVSNYFHEKGVENVIVTLGDKGAYVSSKDDKKFLKPIEVKVVDTTGAGDAFNGGFVAGLSKGMSVLEACEYAMIVAGLSVTKVGTSIAMATIYEINEYINNVK